LGFKEAKGIPVNAPVYNETLYIRFVEAWITYAYIILTI
jgi:hypothetical protein